MRLDYDIYWVAKRKQNTEDLIGVLLGMWRYKRKCRGSVFSKSILLDSFCVGAA